MNAPVRITSTTPSQPILLAYAFRPFFLLAAAWAALSMVLWIAVLFGLPFSPALGSAWHAHELVFAVVGAAAAGFVLTAAANWTGTPPVAGTALLALIVVWVAGRVALLVPGLPFAVVAGVNVAFLPAVAVALLTRLVPSGNRRNYPLAALLLIMAVCQLAWHLAQRAGDGALARAAHDGGLLAISALISIVGGRITPAFTRNWLQRQGASTTVVDRPRLEWVQAAALMVAAAAALLQVQELAAALTLVAAATAGVRLTGWRSRRVLREPLLLILHIAWLWLILALLLHSGTRMGLALPDMLWWHVLGAGAIGTILIGVMTRVSLGHTGRPLVLPTGAVWLYGLITVAALARLGAILVPALWQPLVLLSALAWILGWIGFLIRFGPILCTPRPDGRPG